MCLSKAWVNRDGERELLMEDVAFIEVEGGKLLLKTLFGEQREVEANIKKIDFLNHNIILENLR